jgi:hypothetical protein
MFATMFRIVFAAAIIASCLATSLVIVDQSHHHAKAEEAPRQPVTSILPNGQLVSVEDLSDVANCIGSEFVANGCKGDFSLAYEGKRIRLRFDAQQDHRSIAGRNVVFQNYQLLTGDGKGVAMTVMAMIELLDGQKVRKGEHVVFDGAIVGIEPFSNESVKVFIKAVKIR